MPRLYFDNAATSWPKPDSVYRAVDHAMRDLGVSIGRATYRTATEANRLVEATRDSIARLIGAENRNTIVFTFSCTDSLSTAILGLLQPGDHVVTSVAEHNSVLRPLTHLQRTQSVRVSHVDCDATGRLDPAEILATIGSETKLVVLTHASNVTGTIQDLAPVGKYCQQNGIPFLIDAAQSVGHLSIDLRDLGCDLLAAAGHKGLLGPLGTGFLYVSDRVAEKLRPLRFGGTGSSQVTDQLPIAIPEKMEAGNLNLPGIIGLAAGIAFLNSEEGIELADQSRRQSQEIWQTLDSFSGVTLYGAHDAIHRLPVFALQFKDLDCHEVASILDTQWSIQVRAGLHCAPRLHQRLGTAQTGGLVRISPGLFTTDGQISQLLEAIQSVTATF